MTLRGAICLAAALLVGLLPVAGCGGDDDGGGGSGGGGSVYGGGGGQDGGGQDGGSGDGSGSGSGSGGGSGSRLGLTADPSGALKFDKTSLAAKAGSVTVVLDNPSDVPHAIEVEGDGVEVAGETVGRGGVSKVTADLQAGEYEYYCPVGNHKDAGMEGTLTVR